MCGLRLRWFLALCWGGWGGGSVAATAAAVGGWIAGALLHDDVSLSALNNTARYDINDKLKLFFGDDNDENIFMSDTLNHTYYDTHNFTYNFKQKECIFLSINVCSLMSKHNDLSLFITQLTKNNVNVNVIAIQEIWNIPYPELVIIPGFEFIYSMRQNAHGGGVAFYIKQGITFKIIKNLSIFIEREFECLTIEATINKKKIILSNIYIDHQTHPPE